MTNPQSWTLKFESAMQEGSAHLHVGTLALMLLERAGGTTMRMAGAGNFYAVTRYNWNRYYALAVIELGDAVRALMPSR